MNSVAVLAFLAFVFDCCCIDVLSPQPSATISRVLAEAVGAMTSSTHAAMDVPGLPDQLVFAGKGSRSKKQKAINPWPMSGKIKDPAIELIMLCIGLVVVVTLAIISYRHGL